MLSAKPWKPEAIVRLVFCALLCFLITMLVMTAWHYSGPRGLEGLRVYLAIGGAVGLLTAGVARLQRPWQVDSFGRDMLLLLLCLGPGFGAAVWAQEKAGPPPQTAGAEMMLILEPLLLLLVARFLREHQVSWAEGFGFTNHWRQAVMFGILAACIFLPLAWGMQWTCAQAMVRLHLEPKQQAVVETLRTASTGLNRLSLGAVAMVLAPPVEEIFFRGILYPAVKQAGFPRLALWGAAVLFAWMHFNVMTFLPLLVLAVVLTLLYERTNNLLASITAHALFNAANFAWLCLSLK